MWLDYEQEVRWDLAQFNIVPWKEFDDIELVDFPMMVWPLTLRGEQSVLMQRIWKDQEIRKQGGTPAVDQRREERELVAEEQTITLGIAEIKRNQRIAKLEKQLQQED